MKVDYRYKILHAWFGMFFVLCGGYSVYYLTATGLEPAVIGTLIAIFGVVSAVIQFVAGRIADGSENITYKHVMLVFASVLALCYVGLIAFNGKVFQGIFFGLSITAANSIAPFINQGCFYYCERGVDVDFGSARGIESLTYALMAFITGKLTVTYGYKVIPISGIVLSVFFLSSILYMPLVKGEKTPNKAVKSSSVSKKNKVNFRAFVRKYKVFTLMVAGCTLLLSYNFLDNTYLLPILQNVGGTSNDLGKIIGTASFLGVPFMVFSGKLIEKFGANKIIIFSAVMFILRGVLLLFAGSIVTIFIAEQMYVLTFALNCPATVYYANRNVEPHDRMTGQAVMGMGPVLGVVIGNIVGGFVLQNLGIRWMIGSGIMMAVMGTVMCVIAAIKQPEQV